MSSDEKTSKGEWMLLLALLAVGATMILQPGIATTGAFIDFVGEFPDPSALGPYGSLIALLSLLLGGGGVLRWKYGG